MSYWEKYRNSHEPAEHWEIRKKFLETHQNSYNEDRLVCLAQTFYNTEFLGCRYPEKVMKEIEELSQGIADEHREAKKSKVQRTFVAASEAAESKVCRTGVKRKATDDGKGPGGSVQGQTIHDVMRNQRRPNPQNTASGLDLQLIQRYLDRDPPLSQLILLRMKNETELTFEYLQRSAKISQVKAQFQYNRSDGQIEGTLTIGRGQKPWKSAPLVKTVLENPNNMISKTKKRTIKEKLIRLASSVLHRKHFCVVVSNQFYSSRDMVARGEDEEEEGKIDEREKDPDEIEEERKELDNIKLEQNVAEEERKKEIEEVLEDTKEKNRERKDLKTEDKRDKKDGKEDLDVGDTERKEQNEGTVKANADKTGHVKENVEKVKENVTEINENRTETVNHVLGDTKKDIKDVKEKARNNLEHMRQKRYDSFKEQLAVNNDRIHGGQNTQKKKYVSDDYEKLAENNIVDQYESALLARLTEPSPAFSGAISKPKMKEMRDKLISLADAALKEKHLCIVMDSRFYSSRDMVEKNEGEMEEEEEEKEVDAVGEEKEDEKKYISDEFEKLAENNIGSKLLRLMGWSGSGGLGKSGQGIAEPVPITGRLDKKRTGLGKDAASPLRKQSSRGQGPHQVLTGEDGEATMGLGVNRQDGLQGESFKVWARELLLEYLNSSHLLWFEDLIFASSFTKEERAIIHDTVQKVKQLRLALHAKSYGKNLERQLIVSRKAAKDGRTILSDLILCGDNPKFSLLVPPYYYTWLAQQQ